MNQDDELWIEDGDCLVHLYAPGSSRRGASLKIPLQKLQQTGSHYLLRECLYKPSLSMEADDTSDSGYAPSDSSERDGHCSELYVPAPVELSRQEAFMYHIGTRNYFAYLLNKPIVGERFGTALAHLWSRIETWQPNDTPSEAFQQFCEEQGYLNFAGNLDYAAAALFWSEQAHMRDIWIDAFAHCVGMYDQPDREEKLSILSSSTRGLLHKASLEMHLSVSKATKSLGTFLEQELGPEHLGLSKASRDHLDRFKSTLHSFYVNEFGYFPPGPSEPWDKRMWVRIYNDFHCLYKYLADAKSANGMTNNHGLNGGICVTQNVKAFDERHGFSSLKHPLPLLPEVATRRRILDARRSLGSFSKLGSGESDLLTRAANTSSRRVMGNGLVQAYIRFELQKQVEKVTAAEARKVRWLLVYGVLQMLISVTRAPKEVRDSETPSYPLCVSTKECPPWVEDARDRTSVEQVAARLSAELDIVARTIATDAKTPIQPDCEAQNAEDYFSSGNSTRRNSLMSLSMTPQPLRPALPSRTSSIRSGVTSLRRSMVGSLTRRNSQMSTFVPVAVPAPTTRPARSSQYREIVIEGYGNGADVSTPRPTKNFSGLHLNTLVENIPSDDHQQHPGSALSQISSSAWSRRSGGSTASTNSTQEGPESPMTEMSEEEALEPKTLIVTSTSTSGSPSEEFSSFDFGLEKDGTMRICPPPRTSSMQFAATGVEKTRQGSESSVASSVYPEGSLQAADIEETDARGRRRLGRVEKLRWEAV